MKFHPEPGIPIVYRLRHVIRKRWDGWYEWDGYKGSLNAIIALINKEWDYE